MQTAMHLIGSTSWQQDREGKARRRAAAEIRRKVLLEWIYVLVNLHSCDHLVHSVELF